MKDVISNSNYKEYPDKGYLHLLAKPLLTNDTLVNKATKDEKFNTIISKFMANSQDKSILNISYSPDFGQGNVRQTQNGWSMEFSSRHILVMTIDYDGSASLICNRATDYLHAKFINHEELPKDNNECKLFLENVVAGLTTKFIYILGQLYNKADYYGDVSISVYIPGIKNAESYYLYQDLMSRGHQLIQENEYSQSIKILSEKMESDPKYVSNCLLENLYRVVNNSVYNPLDVVI